LLKDAVLWVIGDSLMASERLRLQQQGLVSSGPCARFLAASWPAAAPVSVAFPDSGSLTLPMAGAGVYRQDDKGRWSWIGNLQTEAASRAARIGFGLPKPGRYAVLSDVKPPGIVPPQDTLAVCLQVDRHRAGVTLPRWQTLVLPLSEEGSGICADSCRLTVDGRMLIVEPDLPRQRLLVELPDTLTAGVHDLEVTVQDRSGLQASAGFPLVCRP
jgi:hypothetical protein